MSDNPVDQFIEVSKQLLTMYNEQEAQEYIASLEGDSARGLVKALWGLEKIRRHETNERGFGV